jgi:hypothetical protein
VVSGMLLLSGTFSTDDLYAPISIDCRTRILSGSYVTLG